jgi:flagellar hook assembly protein FlgD
VPVPFQLKIQVFNSAGELVDVLFNGAVGTLPQTLDGMSSALIQGQPFSYPTLNIAGINPIVWNGDNNAGAFVIGGVYEIQAQIVDTFGQITTLSHTVNVMATPDQQSVRIYNSAGELVRQLILGSPVSGASRLILSTGTLLVGAGGAPSPLTITVGTSGGGGTSLQWDGLGSSGLPVQTGVYTVLLVSLESNNAAVVASRTVMVMKGPDGVSALDSAYVAPNPATLPGPVYLFYKPALLQGDWPRVELFDLSGEKVAEADDPGLTGKIDVTARHKLAGGIYLARFQLMRGDLLDKARTLKVAVAR